EARGKLGIGSEDEDPESIERLADFLDKEADRLSVPSNIDGAIERMANRGDLPSDLYEIEISPDIAKFHGRSFDLEKRLIEGTIKSPSAEQHYGQDIAADGPAMISLFTKVFRTKWPLKDFVMLVGAQRHGKKQMVMQAF